MKTYPLHSSEFKQLQKAFASWLDILGYAESSIYTLPRHVWEFFYYLENKEGITRIDQITGSEVKGFFAWLYQRGHARHPGQPLSDAYLNKYLQALKLLSRYVRQTGQGVFSFRKGFIRPPQELKNICTQAEITTLYDSCDPDMLGLRDRAMLSVFYACGLRRNEGISLDVRDVLLSNKLLYVRKGKNYKERYVPIGDKVVQDFKRYLTESRPGFYQSHQQKAFFLSKKGQRINGQSLSIRLKRLVEKAGLSKEITLHTLRHSIATHLLENGMKIQQIAHFLGHSSLESTQIYLGKSALK
ncbi:tyrosine-type recombinase/integrase [Flexithrix dorotheae]|uniref:tyrosine-type recombinase/integrase n=1 Tax=Flexithrix dorotheae TaxID=70993 RepID=UPI00037F02F2|nr:tyrosine-type recombinase/integrase [Flexithrix dorotheae]